MSIGFKKDANGGWIAYRTDEVQSAKKELAKPKSKPKNENGGSE